MGRRAHRGGSRPRPRLPPPEPARAVPDPGGHRRCPRRPATADATDWSQIVALYDQLYALRPNAVVALNRAIAIAELRSPAHGLAALDSFDSTLLAHYQPFHAARADLLARAGQRDAARDAYARAIELSVNPAERHFLERQRDSLRSE